MAVSVSLTSKSALYLGFTRASCKGLTSGDGLEHRETKKSPRFEIDA
jgi:hypothetical protein